MEERELTDYDVFLVRKFCEDELRKYLPSMRDFWKHAESYMERGPGEHSLLDSKYTGEVGYKVEKRKIQHGNVRNLAAYPFVRTRALKVLPSGGGSKFVLRRALDEPLRIEEFYCVLDSDRRVAFLTREAYSATCFAKSEEACVSLGREEAYAILAGETLNKTRKKIMRAFDMEEGEWLDGGAF